MQWRGHEVLKLSPCACVDTGWLPPEYPFPLLISVMESCVLGTHTHLRWTLWSQWGDQSGHLAPLQEWPQESADEASHFVEPAWRDSSLSSMALELCCWQPSFHDDMMLSVMGMWGEAWLWRQGLGPWSLVKPEDISTLTLPSMWTNKIPFYLNSFELSFLQLVNKHFCPAVYTSVAWTSLKEGRCSSFLLTSDVSPSSQVLVSTKKLWCSLITWSQHFICPRNLPQGAVSLEVLQKAFNKQN